MSDRWPCRMSHHVALFPFRLTRARMRKKERKPVMIRHASCNACGAPNVVPMPPIAWERVTAAQLFLSLSRNFWGDCR